MRAAASNGKRYWKAIDTSRKHRAPMGLLSFLRSRPAPEDDSALPHTEDAAKTSQPGPLWRSGVFESYPVGEQSQAVHRPGAVPVILPGFAVEFALKCEEFKPVEEHVAEYASQHGWDSLQVESLERLLPAMHAAGVL